MRSRTFALITRAGFFTSSVNPTNPSLRANGEIPGRPWKARVTNHRLVGVSTMLFRPTGQIDSDKVAPECNKAARRGTDCWPGVRAYRDRYVEVSRQNAVSMGIRRVTPWPRTRFASQFAVDTARRTAGAGLDYPAWVLILICVL